MVVHAQHFAGSKNDHIKQNEADVSNKLVAAQMGQMQEYDVSSDKGFHLQPCVVPMFNNMILTAREVHFNNRWSPLRSMAEIILSITFNTWKYLQYVPQHHNSTRQPLTLFVRVGFIMTNVITTLDWNTVTEYYRVPPPELEHWAA